MRERPTPEEFKGGGEPRPRGVRGFIEKLSPRKKMIEEREKEQHFIREFERGDLRVQKHYISEEEAHKDIREISDIKLINKRGESYSLKDELPRKYKFIEAAGLGTTREIMTKNDAVWFPEIYMDVAERKKETTVGPEVELVTEKKDFLKEKEGAFLILYHEIAHLRHRHRLSKSLSLKKRLEQLEKFELIAASREEVLTGKDKERYDKLVLGEERYAWAFALRKIRELRRKGFDVEPTFDNPKKLKEFLHSLLRTYEKPPGQELFETLQEIIKSKSLEESAKKEGLQEQLAEIKELEEKIAKRVKKG